jgi:hypothetical protein
MKYAIFVVNDFFLVLDAMKRKDYVMVGHGFDEIIFYLIYDGHKDFLF